jgi:curli biogenesis system outer membrane secretion channel CsgG
MRKFVRVMAAAAALVIVPLHAQPVDNGLKKTIAVDQFATSEATGGQVTAEGLTSMLIDALVRDGHFIVVERGALASVQAEQALGTSAAASTETAPKTGQLIGASAIIRGAVTKYEAAAHGSGFSIGGAALGSFMPGAGSTGTTALIEISLRLIDTTTGQVVGTYNAQGKASASSTTVGVTHRSGATLGASTFSATPLGQAAQDAIVKAVAQISEGMKKVPWSTEIVEADPGKIYVSGGSDRNMQPGMLLTVYHKGKVFTDPATGEVLDVEMTKVCTLKIAEVREKLSIATLVDGTAPTRGDVVKQ